MPVCMADTKTVEQFIKQLKANGCKVTHRKNEGTVKATDGTTEVYRALQKGKNGPWIVRTQNSERIKWTA
jgi:hypothetical protein